MNSAVSSKSYLYRYSLRMKFLVTYSYSTLWSGIIIPKPEAITLLCLAERVPNVRLSFLIFFSSSFSRRRCASVRKISGVTKIDTTRADLFDVFSLLPPGFHFHVTSTLSTLAYREFPSRDSWITREVKKRQSVTIGWQITHIYAFIEFTASRAAWQLFTHLSHTLNFLWRN